LLLVTVALFAGTPLILSSIEQRAGNDTETSDANRSKLTDEAERIIADYPLGVGANQYVHVAQKEGYRKADQDWGIMVHNVYLLIAAETGHFGLFTFLVYLLYPLSVAFRSGWRFRGNPVGDLLLGIGMALLAVYLQGFFEFEFLESVVQYTFALELGMVAGLARYTRTALQASPSKMQQKEDRYAIQRNLKPPNMI
jgi:O-antigen ligase